MTSAEIQSISNDNFAKFSELDRSGFLVAPDEPPEKYRARVSSILDDLEQFNTEISQSGTTELLDTIKISADERISKEILDEAASINDKEYDFAIDWVPGFFPKQNIGPLWGGCAISFDETQLAIFIVRANFAKQKKWLFYRRDELLSHELCHIARMPLQDKLYEEFFAYRLSPSPFRRYFGSCFRTQADSFLFIIPIFMLLAAQIITTLGFVNLPTWPFWIIALIFPIFLLLRNHYVRKTAFRAANNLSSFGINKPWSILFRSVSNEIREMSKIKSEKEFKKWINTKAQNEFRWRLISYRFQIPYQD